MSSKLVNFAKDVKQERFNIKVECLVIQEQLRYQAQVLSIDFVFLAICFIYRQSPFPINFFPWWLPPRTLTLETKYLHNFGQCKKKNQLVNEELLSGDGRFFLISCTLDSTRISRALELCHILLDRG